MFKYSLDNKRYHTLNYYYKTKYQQKVFKVSLNGGFSCPNKVNGPGCIFCSSSGSGEFAGNINDDLITQFNQVKEIMEHKWSNSLYIGYFQANTNTYAPTEILKEKYETILSLPNVIGLNIATRSDAISDETLDYLTELNTRTDLTIELGLQSIHAKTLKFINRGHTLENFTTMVNKLHQRNIKVVAHIINGLPNETKQDMLDTVIYLNTLPIHGIKIHMLYLIKDTPLYQYYQEHPFHLLTKEEYIDIVTEQLEYLRPEIVIHRIISSPKKEDLFAPTWLIKKREILNDIDKKLKEKDTYQGAKVPMLITK